MVLGICIRNFCAIDGLKPLTRSTTANLTLINPSLEGSKAEHSCKTAGWSPLGVALKPSNDERKARRADGLHNFKGENSYFKLLNVEVLNHKRIDHRVKKFEYFS